MAFADALNEDYWTGVVNPDLITCDGHPDCENQVTLASDGARYNTTVYPDHGVVFRGDFCARYRVTEYQGTPKGIYDKICSSPVASSCEFTCNKESK